MTYEQLENCYKTVLKQRDDAETQLQLRDDRIEKLEKFILEVAEPALILAVHDYPVSNGPRGNLTELELLKKELNF